jgi:hypothetical protein
MGIREALQRRKARKALEKYISPEALEKLVREGKHGINAPEAKHFQFVAILADDTKAGDVPGLIRSIFGTLDQHRATFMSATPPLVVAVLGAPFPEGNSAETRREFVGGLLLEHGDRIRIAHGECDGLCGNMGGPRLWTYNVVIPGFSGILQKLLAAKFGTAIEIEGK